MAKNEEELKSVLMKVEEESEKADLNLNIKKLRSWHPVPSLYNKKMGEISILKYADDTTLMAESKELKSLFTK